MAEDIQQKDTSPQLSHRQKKDQHTQASDTQQLKKLVTNLEQVTQKMKTFVFGKGVASVEGEDILKEAVHTSLSLSPPQTTNGNFRAQLSQAQAENRKLWNQLSNTQAESILLLDQLNEALDGVELC